MIPLALAGGFAAGFLLGGASITQIINIYYSFMASAIINAIGTVKNECVNFGTMSQSIQLYCENPGRRYLECLERVHNGELNLPQCSYLAKDYYLDMVRSLCTGGTINQSMDIRFDSLCVIDNTDDFERFQTTLGNFMREARELFESFDFAEVLENLGAKLDAIDPPKLTGWQRFTGASITQITNLTDNITRTMDSFIDMNIVNSFITALYASQEINIKMFGFNSLDQTMALTVVVRILSNIQGANLDDSVRQVSEEIFALEEKLDTIRNEVKDDSSSLRVNPWIIFGVVSLIITISVFVAFVVILRAKRKNIH